MARSRLSQMPRSVECSATEKKGELRVTWESIDSHRHKCKTIRVVLHRRGCEQEHILDRSYIHGGGKYLEHYGYEFYANDEQIGFALASLRCHKLSATESHSQASVSAMHTFLLFQETLRGLSFLHGRSLRNLWRKTTLFY